MNKSDLILALQNQTGIKKQEDASIVEMFFNDMKDAMAEGDRIEIRELFSFFVKQYREFQGRNPKTGESVTVKPKKMPFFKCGRELKERVNQ